MYREFYFVRVYDDSRMDFLSVQTPLFKDQETAEEFAKTLSTMLRPRTRICVLRLAYSEKAELVFEGPKRDE